MSSGKVCVSSLQLVRLPASIPMELAMMTEPLSVALHTLIGKRLESKLLTGTPACFKTSPSHCWRKEAEAGREIHPVDLGW